MLSNPTIETLKSLKLQGMIQALESSNKPPRSIASRSMNDSRSSLIENDCTATIIGACACCAGLA